MQVACPWSPWVHMQEGRLKWHTALYRW